ncbi:GNAT family N-acetyltransferase [Bifidobacterium aquikefiri]|uniref:GNAT family N-acetyltransferase n=1 Tax=Bifidobacterium aquikefiri TaxID=1653207 RepID=UPI0023F34923|nr:GNAT family N-acetyltransferase [Bifidobacterium aquikefiri]
MRELTTEALILRAWRANDDAETASLYQYAQDPDVGPSAGWAAHANAEESAAVIRTVLCNAQSYAIVLKNPEDKGLIDKPIGSISLQSVPEQVMRYIETLELHEHDGIGNTMELGFWIGKPFWGRGLVPQASFAVIEHGFNDLKLNAIWCRHDIENVKSGRAQDKIGFEHVGIIRHIHMNMLPGDIYRDEELRLITREQWEKRSHS